MRVLLPVARKLKQWQHHTLVIRNRHSVSPPCYRPDALGLHCNCGHWRPRIYITLRVARAPPEDRGQADEEGDPQNRRRLGTNENTNGLSRICRGARAWLTSRRPISTRSRRSPAHDPGSVSATRPRRNAMHDRRKSLRKAKRCTSNLNSGEAIIGSILLLHHFAHILYRFGGTEHVQLVARQEPAVPRRDK